MIPVGTPCYIATRVSNTGRDHSGHVCTIVGYGHSPQCYRCGAARVVCHVRMHTGDLACVTHWSDLRPITPPPQSTDTPTDVPRETEAA